MPCSCCSSIWLNVPPVRRSTGTGARPVVLTREEVRRLCEAMDGTFGLMTRLMYGTGTRLMECIRLRVGDLDFGHPTIIVRNGKGGKDRIVPLPESLRTPLESHLERVKALHERDLAA
ncbi:MAG: tyrosine-type recombinase/integrase, partial [Chromatiaceae bacterium]|nr:tyrosine-type recombinase/integrase [Chromatiaceae bacterium]